MSLNVVESHRLGTVFRFVQFCRSLPTCECRTLSIRRLQCRILSTPLRRHLLESYRVVVVRATATARINAETWLKQPIAAMVIEIIETSRCGLVVYLLILLTHDPICIIGGIAHEDTGRYLVIVSYCGWKKSCTTLGG